MPQNKLSQGEIDYIFRSPEALRVLADFWEVQETLFDGVGDGKGAQIAKECAQDFKWKATAAQRAIDNGE